jgi:c-di-GMP-binding flagellar brake protein YcgR
MFCTGDTVILDDLESEELETYRSKLVEYTENEFVMDYPIHEISKKMMILETGRKLQIYVVTKDQKVFTFSSEILGRKLQQIPVLVFSFPGVGNLTQVQRRKYVRVEALLNVHIKALSNEFTPFTTTTVNISAGGMAIRLPRTYTYTPNRTISLQFSLVMRDGSVRELQLIGKEVVVREQNGEQAPMLSIEFTNIHDIDRQALVRYCFEQQLLLRKKR